MSFNTRQKQLYADLSKMETNKTKRKKNMFKLLSKTIAASVLIFGCAYNTYADTGLYLISELGVSKGDLEIEAANWTYTEKDTVTAISGGIGYAFTNNFAIEGNIKRFNSDDEVDGGNILAVFRSDPDADGFRLIGKVGYAGYELESGHEFDGYTIAAGFEQPFNEHIFTSFMLSHTNTDADGVVLGDEVSAELSQTGISLGLVYQF